MNIVSSDLTSNNLTFKINSVDAIKVATNGYVGIGTTTPSQILQVGDGGRLRISNGITDYTMIGTKETDDASNTRIVVSGFQRTSTDLSGGSIEYIATNTSGAHVFKTSNNERMRITGAGNVGIGITTPSVTLDVSGTALVRNEVWRRYGTANYIQPLTINGTFDTNTGFNIPLLLHSTSGFNIVELKLSFVHKYTSNTIDFFIGSVLSETGTAQAPESSAYEIRYPNNGNTFVGLSAQIGFSVPNNAPLHANILFSKTPGNTLITFTCSASTYWNASGSSGMLIARTSGYHRTTEGHRVSITSNTSVNVVGTYSLTAYV